MIYLAFFVGVCVGILGSLGIDIYLECQECKDKPKKRIKR